MLSNNERTQQVIKNAMIKLGISGDPDEYTLSQVFADKGMFISFFYTRINILVLIGILCTM